MEPEHSTDRKRPSNSYLSLSGFAFQLLGGIGFGAWLGHKLDLFLELEFPIFLLMFMLAMLTGMLYLINRKLNQE